MNYNENKEIKRNDLYLKLDYQLFKMLINQAIDPDDFEAREKNKNDIARQLFFTNKLEINRRIIASNKRNDLEWVNKYFWNVRIKSGYINTKKYYFLDYAGNYEIHKNYYKNKGENPNDKKYILHVNDFLENESQFLRDLKEMKQNYYIKYFENQED